MEPDVIAAMCELLAHEQGIVDASIKHDYKLLKAHGDKNRSPVEKFINAQITAEKTKSKRHRDAVEKLRPAYEAAIADPDTASSLDQRATLDAYRDQLVEHAGADLDSGAAVIVGLSGHFVKLQSIQDDHVLVNDPARDARAAMATTRARFGPRSHIVRR